MGKPGQIKISRQACNSDQELPSQYGYPLSSWAKRQPVGYFPAVMEPVNQRVYWNSISLLFNTSSSGYPTAYVRPCFQLLLSFPWTIPLVSSETCIRPTHFLTILRRKCTRCGPTGDSQVSLFFVTDTGSGDVTPRQEINTHTQTFTTLPHNPKSWH